MRKRVQTSNENERKKSEIPDETDDYDRRGVNFVTRFVGPAYTLGDVKYNKSIISNPINTLFNVVAPMGLATRRT